MFYKNGFRKVFSGFLTLGTILAIGTLSFIGAFEFTNAVLICGLAFGLAGFVDGQVYWENINSALKNLLEPRASQRAALRSTLEDLYQIDPALNTDKFLSQHFSACQYLKYLRKHHHRISKFERKKIKLLEKRIQLMEELLLKYLEDPQREAQTSMELTVKVLSRKPEFNEVLKKGARKRNLAALAFGVSLLAGGFNFFATLGAYQAALEVAAISSVLSVIPGGIIIVLMAFAAVSFTLMVYQGCLDAMNRKIFSSWSQAVTHCAKNKSPWLKGVVYLSAALTVAIILFATLATGGTWFQLVPNGASLFSITESLVSAIRIIGVIALSVPLTLFSMVNVLEPVKKLLQKLAAGKIEFREKLARNLMALLRAWGSESLWQFFNPFRLIIFLLTKIIFAGHVIADGFAGDGFPEPVSAATSLSFTNGVTEAAYVFHNDDESTDARQIRDDENADVKQTDAEQIRVVSDPEKAQLFLAEENPLDINDKHDHHSHGFENLVLFFPKLAGCIWDFVGGWIWHVLITLPYQYFCRPIYPISPPSLSETRGKFFPTPAKAPEFPYKASPEWLKQEVAEIIQENIDSYSKCSISLGDKNTLKQAFVTRIKSLEILATEQKVPVDSSLSMKILTFRSENRQSLARHRLLPLGSTASMSLLRELGDMDEYMGVHTQMPAQP